MENFLTRSVSLLGEEAINKLYSKKVAVLGLGGVGSFAFEALVRSGIGNIVAVDKDVIEETNLNRQLLALNSTLKKSKAALAKERGLDINPALNITAYEEFICKDNLSRILSECDYVADCIDTVSSKLDVIEYCKNNFIPVISSMGMGNRIDPEEITLCDIYDTNNCPLSKVMRSNLRKRGIESLDVVFSKEAPKVKQTEIASMIFVPSSAGILMAKKIITDLIK